MTPQLAVIYPWDSPFFYTKAHDNMVNLERPDGWTTKFFRGEGWCPARRHANGCEQALQWGADLLCIIGADQVHADDMLPRLVRRFQEGYEVIAALVNSRGFVSWQPMRIFQKMAWRFKTNTELGADAYRTYRSMALDGDLVKVIDPNEGDVQPINFIGSGVLMFHRDHLLALKRPWFKETVEPDGPTSGFRRYANQDCMFVRRLQTEAHARCWVDTTINVTHLHIFPIDDTFSDRFADWEQPGVGDPSICRHAELGKGADDARPEQAAAAS